MEQKHSGGIAKPNISKIAFYLILVVGIVVIAAIGVYAYQLKQDYDKVTKENKVLKDPIKSSEVQQQQAQAVVLKLGKILKIDDTDKQPAVATITDVEKLKTSQPEFYKNADKDDYLIVYPNRAIIYREKDNQIINIAPIIQPPASSATSTPATTVQSSSVNSTSSLGN
jgi:hypothetical protein